MLINIVVEKSRYHVIGGSDGVEVARKVKIYLLHRQHLGIAATCSSTFHTKARAERWFTKGGNGLLANAVHT